MEIINKFKAPERWSDYNIVCFAVQLLVIIITSFMLFSFFIYKDPEFGDMSGKEGVVASFLDGFTADEDEARLLRKIPSLNSDEKLVKTDKFIDLENGGLWLTQRQDGMLGIICISICFSGVILVFVGAGPIYRLVRQLIGKLTLYMCPFFIFIIPFGIWGALVSIILAVVGYLTLILSPLILTAHLILGILQFKMLRGGSANSGGVIIETFK